MRSPAFFPRSASRLAGDFLYVAQSVRGERKCLLTGMHILMRLLAQELGCVLPTGDLQTGVEPLELRLVLTVAAEDLAREL